MAAHIGGLVGGVLVAMMVGVPDKSKTKDIINGTILTIIYLIFISYLAFFGGNKMEKLENALKTFNLDANFTHEQLEKSI